LLSGEEIAFAAGNFLSPSFDKTGALWTASGAGLVRWPVAPVAGTPSRLRIGPPEWVADVLLNGHDGFTLSASGQVAVVPLYNQGALVVHCDTPRRTLRIGPQYDVRHVWVSPDGRWVVTGSHWRDDSRVYYKIWKADTGKLVANLPFPDVSECYGFSPDSRWLYVSGKQGGRLEVASLAANPAPPAAPAVAPGPPPWQEGWRSEKIRLGGTFSPDNRLAAFGREDGSIQLVLSETDQEIARLPSPEVGRISASGFSPDGSLLLASGEETGALYVFDLRRIRMQLAELGLDWDLPPFPPARPEETNPTLALPLRVKLIDAEWATSKSKMAEFESNRAVARLFFNPFDVDAHYRLGERLYDAGKPQPAFAHLTAALAFRPDLDDARSARARAAFRLGRWADAVTDATRYLEKSPSDDNARYLRAVAEMRRKHYEKAIGDFDSLLKAYPTDSKMYELRAQCHEALGKAGLAKIDRAQALKVGPRNPETLNSQAWKLVTGPAGQRDPARALVLIQDAVKQQPGNAMYLNTLGVVQYRNGQIQEALATLEKSLAAGQGQFDAFDLFFLAMCHARLDDTAKAKECFDRAVRWWDGQKGLSAQWVEELRSFRAEAEALLKGKAD
jgi:eukaryotic-like serine/threonine-protein kinase